ncbi:hypothetical protein [Streptomyces sp. 7-21]|uniref:hypothetical protein n=1 Tax=Streptomyces sp. 7-21 TaxID=2802283 RepID=UPI00191CDE2A|nr:hypothetical protein [Streptomyces sp. 7-21]MBL1068680.1 hypothetical protein [Streptomyces sp. 7-21]
MKDSTGTTKQEAYSFACLACGHTWEQTYTIEHDTDRDGKEFVRYHAGGREVPSPLTSPDCHTCGSHRVRVMRSGLVDRARHARDVVGYIP